MITTVFARVRKVIKLAFLTVIDQALLNIFQHRAVQFCRAVFDELFNRFQGNFKQVVGHEKILLVKVEFSYPLIDYLIYPS